MHYSIYTDASAKPNESKLGIVIYNNDNEVIAEYSKTMPKMTNNEAEYSAVIEALNEFIKVRQSPENKDIKLYSDSQLVINQLNKKYQIRCKRLYFYHDKIQDIISQNNLNVEFIYIPRAQNTRADSLTKKKEAIWIKKTTKQRLILT